MFTTSGRNHIRRYLAQYVPSIANAMAFGVGTRAAVGGDIALHFEVLRAEITSVVYDFATNKLIYKATIPADFAGVITEVGLYSLFEDPKAGAWGTRILTDIDEGEGWTNVGTTGPSTFFTSETAGRVYPKIGTSGLRQTPAASGSQNDSLTNLVLDLSGYSNADFVTLALHVNNAFTSSVTVRFMTDSSNYYTFTVTTAVQTSGYKVVELLKSAAVATGAPDWGAINEIRLTTNSTAGGASQVTWDGIGFVDTDTANLDYTLVARKVLDTPATVIANQTQELEFTVDVTL